MILKNWTSSRSPDSRNLSDLEEGIGLLLDDFIGHLKAGDVAGYLRANAAIGRTIAARDVAFEDFIDGFHDFEDSYAQVIFEAYPIDALHSLTALDRLHHKTLGILANEYFALKDRTIFALAKLAESRDPETGAHLERTQEYSSLLARGLGLDDSFVTNIHEVSPLHDIGKVGIPDAILLKPARLTPE